MKLIYFLFLNKLFNEEVNCTVLSPLVVLPDEGFGGKNSTKPQGINPNLAQMPIFT